MIQNFSCSVSRETLSMQFGDIRISSKYKGTYNIHPGQNAWLLIGEDPSRIVPAMWGYPEVGDDKGQRITLYLADGNNIATSSTFRMSIRQRRCVIIADSYYVWRTRGDKRQSFRAFSRDLPVLMFGGVYEHREIQGRDVICFSLIQTEASSDVAEIYHKMPLVINQEDLTTWLNADTSIRDVLEMIRPLKRYSLQHYQVTNQIMDRGFNHSEAHSRKLEHLTLFDQ